MRCSSILCLILYYKNVKTVKYQLSFFSSFFPPGIWSGSKDNKALDLTGQISASIN